MNWEEEDIRAVVSSGELFLGLVRELRKCCADLGISMTKIRQTALLEIARSSEYWKGPNAELFRKSAERYVDGALNVPRRQIRTMPIGLARAYAKGLVDEFKVFEKDLEEVVEKVKNSKRELADVRDNLNRTTLKLKDYESYSRPSTYWSDGSRERLFLLGELEQLKKEETACVNRMGDNYSQLRKIFSRFKTQSDVFKDDLLKCSRDLAFQGRHFDEILNNLQFRVLWEEIKLPASKLEFAIKDVILGASANQEILPEGLAPIISDLALEVPRNAKDFEKLGKVVQEHLDKYPGAVSRNFKAFSGAITALYSSWESISDWKDSDKEKFFWTQYVESVLSLPNGIFERFFKPHVDAAFRDNLVSRLGMNLFKMVIMSFALGVPGGIVATVAVGIAANYLMNQTEEYVDLQLEKKLEQKLEFAVVCGFADWRMAERDSAGIDPLLYSAADKV